ncbi:MAG: DUF4350 domain-containing protein [Myxococcota bacterium]
MTSRARISLAVALLAMLFVGTLWSARAPRERGADTYGLPSWGQRAAYDVLREAGVPVERSFAAPAALPEGATVWWIAPFDACALLASAQGEDERARPWDPVPWVRRGGTAVLFLPAESLACLGRARIAGVAVPRRWVDGVDRDASVHAVADLDARLREWMGDAFAAEKREQFVSGRIAPRARVLFDVGIASFEAAGAWDVAASVDGRPFVLERAVGAGRVALVADAGIARNGALATGDNAPLLFDLVDAYGVPRIDEREHGHAASSSAVATLARSRAAPVFAGTALVLALLVWRAHALPRRALVDPPRAAPTVDAFVDSLALLYARSGDRARVLARYRELSLRRLQRALRLPHETPPERVLEIVRAHPRVDPAHFRMLAASDADPSPGRVRRVARALDALVGEVSR